MKFDKFDLRSYGLKRDRSEDYSGLYLYKAYRLGRVIIYGMPEGDHINAYAVFNKRESTILQKDLPASDKLGRYNDLLRLEPTKESVGKFINDCKEYNDLCDKMEQDRIPTYEQILERLTFVKEKAVNELTTVTTFMKTDEFIERFIKMKYHAVPFFQSLVQDLVEAADINVEEKANSLANTAEGAVYMVTTEYLLTKGSREYDAIVREVINKK